MNDNYILPEKWYIKITEETISYINKYRNIKIPRIQNIDINYYFKYVGEDGWVIGGVDFINNHIGYIRQELTLDIFKKYVLKENINDIDDFVLPEKWCVKGTTPVINKKTKEERQLLPINIYLKKFDKSENWNFTDDNYYYIDKNNNCTYFPIYLKSKNKNYIEITYNQFLKYVIKQGINQIKSTNNTKTYTIDDIKTILKNNYDGDDVNDIIKIIENG